MKITVAAVPLITFAFALPSDGQRAGRVIDVVRQERCDDMKTRLDVAALELQKDSAAKLYIIFYGGKSYWNGSFDRRTGEYVGPVRRLLPKRDEARVRAGWWKPYMVNTRDVEASRIELVDGGFRPEFTAEFWLVPSGAEPPTPRPTVLEKDIRFRRGRPNCHEMFGPSSECGCVGF